MSYEVLARKWRPARFADVVGQEPAVRALQNALSEGRLHHAYLFTGTRGVGKTTLARIMARALNCEQGIVPEPCGTCGSCSEISEGRFPDLVEVDAASRTKVEDTRELLENIQYAPVRGRFRVYLIDEVHMLSGHSFNALLKTLEEPPGHVKFLLATTDPRKLPATVLSRCLQFHLRRIPLPGIISHLQGMLKEEKVSAEEGALRLLARAAEGSLRDAISLCDQAIAHGGGKLEQEQVGEMLGTVDRGRVFALLEALGEGDGAKLLGEVAEMSMLCPDYEGVLAELLGVVHHLAVLQAVPDMAAAEQGEELERLAQHFTPEELQLFYQAGVIGRRDFSLAPDPRSALEMSLLRMLAFRPGADAVRAGGGAQGEGSEKSTGGTDAKNIHNGGQKSGEKKALEGRQDAGVAAEQGADNESASVAKGAGNMPVNGQEIPSVLFHPEEWNALVESLSLEGFSAQVARNCAVEKCEGNQVFLVLDDECCELFQRSEERCVADIERALGEAFAQAVRISISIGQPVAETLQNKRARHRQEERAAAEKQLQQDPNVQLLQKHFGARLDPASIQFIDRAHGG